MKVCFLFPTLKWISFEYLKLFLFGSASAFYAAGWERQNIRKREKHFFRRRNKWLKYIFIGSIAAFVLVDDEAELFHSRIKNILVFGKHSKLESRTKNNFESFANVKWDFNELKFQRILHKACSSFHITNIEGNPEPPWTFSSNNLLEQMFHLKSCNWVFIANMNAKCFPSLEALHLLVQSFQVICFRVNQS